MLRIYVSILIILFTPQAYGKGTNVFSLGIYDIKFDGSEKIRLQILDMNLEVISLYLTLAQKKIIFSSLSLSLELNILATLRLIF